MSRLTPSYRRQQRLRLQAVADWLMATLIGILGALCVAHWAACEAGVC